VQVLLEQEEAGQAGGQPAIDGQLVAEGGDGLGEQVEQGPANQRPGRQRHQR
jgi:hypothetical protein